MSTINTAVVWSVVLSFACLSRQCGVTADCTFEDPQHNSFE